MPLLLECCCLITVEMVGRSSGECGEEREMQVVFSHLAGLRRWKLGLVVLIVAWRSQAIEMERIEFQVESLQWWWRWYVCRADGIGRGLSFCDGYDVKCTVSRSRNGRENGDT